MCQSNVQSHQGRGTGSTHLQPDKQNMIYNYRITELRNSLSSQRFQRFFVSLHKTRLEQRGAKIEKWCDWSNSLLHSRHWVLFASIFLVPFKSNYHSDQLLQKIFGKFSCSHLAYTTHSLFITLTYCILTNFHSDQLSL